MRTGAKRMQGVVLYDFMMRDIKYRLVRGTLGERVEAVSRVFEANRQDLTRRDIRA